MATNRSFDTHNQLIDPVVRCLTPASARQLVGLRASPAVQERLDYLAARCTEGQLTPDERAEYEACVRLVDFIALLQAKARRLLADDSPPDSAAG